MKGVERIMEPAGKKFGVTRKIALAMAPTTILGGYIVLTPTVAQAYAFLPGGCRQLTGSGNSVNFAVTAVGGYAAGYRSMAAAWSNNTDINFYESLPSSAVVVAHETFGGNNGYYGWANFYCRNGNLTTPTNIYVNRSLTDGKDNNANNEVLLHELGHSLGLDHVSDVNQVMYTYGHAEPYKIAPQGDDINGVNALY